MDGMVLSDENGVRERDQREINDFSSIEASDKREREMLLASFYMLGENVQPPLPAHFKQHDFGLLHMGQEMIELYTSRFERSLQVRPPSSPKEKVD